MVGAFASTKIFYETKHTLGAFKTIETTNVISLIIIPISPPRRVYQSST
jgi:hypothetical protein